METWSWLEQSCATVQLLCVSDSRYPLPHWIIVTRRIRSKYIAGPHTALREIGGDIELGAIYVGGPLHWKLGHVATFGGSVLEHGDWVKITNGYVHVNNHLQGLGLGAYLFDAVVAWTQSLGLPNARVWPISLTPGGSSEGHRRAARFYQRFGIDMAPRDKGPPRSGPGLRVSDLKRCPSTSIEVKSLAKGLSEMTDRALGELDDRLRTKHGDEIKRMHRRADRLHRIAAVGWGVVLVAILGLVFAFKSNVI